MPRKATEYSKSLIYKICCKDPSITEIYVGSTTDIIRRRQCHKNSCNNPNYKNYSFKVYQFIREHGGWINWEMILIEYYPCTTKLELGRREDHFKNELQPRLNMITPPIYENATEWVEAHQDEINEYMKQYYQKNKEIINERITCECGCLIRKKYIQKHQKSKKHINLIKNKI